MAKFEAFEARLNELLDARRDPLGDGEIVRAAEQSSQCRKLLAAYRLMLEGTNQLSRPQAPADLSERVLAGVAVSVATPISGQPSVWRRWSRGSVIAVAMAISAAVLFMVLLIPPREPQPMVQRATPPAASPTGVADNPGGQESVSGQELTGGNESASGTHESIPEVAVVPNRSASESVASDSPRSETPPSPEVQAAIGDLLALATGMVVVPGATDRSAGSSIHVEWIDRVGTGMKPVTESTTNFLDTLFEAFPAEDDRSS